MKSNEFFPRFIIITLLKSFINWTVLFIISFGSRLLNIIRVYAFLNKHLRF